MILLDTHSLIWWVNRHAELSLKALAAIEAEHPGGEILISALTAWEIPALAQSGRLGLRMEPVTWLARIGALAEVRFIPVDNAIALQAATLPAPAPGAMPACILAATARHFGCPLVTANARLHAYPHIRTIW